MIYEVQVYDNVHEKWGEWLPSSVTGIERLHGGTRWGSKTTVEAVKLAQVETVVDGIQRRFRARDEGA